MANKNLIPINRVNKFFSLYGLYCPISNELRYVGITTGSLSARLCGHLRKPTNGKIALWFKELSKRNEKPIIRLIEEYETYAELLIGEITKIKQEREINSELLNIADGGDINPMFGKTHTEEAREKISKTHKGRKLTKEQLEFRKDLLTKLWSCERWAKQLKSKMSQNMLGNSRALGNKHSEETKQLLSGLHKGNKYCLGYKHSDKTKNKMSENNSGEGNPMYGKSLPIETIIKRSEKVKMEGTFKGENNPNFKYVILKDDLYKLFIIDNLTIKEISIIYGCSIKVINNNLRLFSINKPKSNKYNLDINQILQYKKNGFSLVKIGELYGCSNKIIHKYIKKHE